MKKIVAFFIACLAAGYALHQTSRITKTLADGWAVLANYVIGVMGVLPFFAILLRMMGFTQQQVLQAVVAYLAAYVDFGTGVSWARLNDRQSDTEEK